VGRHSEEPAIFAEMIERYYPTTSKLEMFARGPARPGWDAWENEVG
jgi:N6-adenosine-specific RNA methylase IME4